MVNPSERGLYRTCYEHDACGVGLIARISGQASHQIVEQGLEILCRLAHRGAIGGDGGTGDGAGISLQLHRAFLEKNFPQIGFKSGQTPDSQNAVMPSYALAMLFVSPEHEQQIQTLFERQIATFAQSFNFGPNSPTNQKLEFVGWRKVPVVMNTVGELARSAMPAIYQALVRFAPQQSPALDDAYIYFLRRKMELAMRSEGYGAKDFYFCSFSTSLLVYKGMFTAPQLAAFYPDLQDPALKSAYALVHQRYSTNTLPQWHLAQPFHHLAHNGEINTIEHNIRSFAIRETDFESPIFGKRVRELAPTFDIKSDEGFSDSACFDSALAALVHNGRSLAEVLSMMVPEPFGAGTDLSQEVAAYYHYQSLQMEPWDGPAAIVASTGRQISAVLDRNGLRPARFTITQDGRLILGSEAGVLPVEAENIAQQGKLSPGKLLLIDLEAGRLYFDQQLKRELAAQAPYSEWLSRSLYRGWKQGLQNNPKQPQPEEWQAKPGAELEAELIANGKQALSLLSCQLREFGYSYENLCDIIAPMAEDAIEPIGSMASPLALAALAAPDREHPSQSISSYFRQAFAQVTNPPIDPYREAAVMSLRSFIGARGNLLRPHKNVPEKEDTYKIVELEHPIFAPDDLENFANLLAEPGPKFQNKPPNNPQNGEEYPKKAFSIQRISLLIPDQCDQLLGETLRKGLLAICEQSEAAAQSGKAVLLLSDRGLNGECIPLPALLALGAVHQHLVRKGLRSQVSLSVESGEIFSVHHFATLIAYGADFLCPYMAYRALGELKRRKLLGGSENSTSLGEAIENYIEATRKGLLKVMSKMGVSTLQSYQNSRLYEILGLSSEVVDFCFAGTPNPIQGKGFAELEHELRLRHAFAWEPKNLAKAKLHFDGSQRLRNHLNLYHISPTFSYSANEGIQENRHEGQQENEAGNEIFSPMSIVYLQQAVRNNDYQIFRRYSSEIEHAGRHTTLRGLLRIQSDRKPIALETVEPIEKILTRFVSGAMSYGSLSKEAHEAIAIAMNRIGARSNSGEGGEDPQRYTLLPNGDDRRSRIKQIASGRFGVNSYYLANADELQIKMAQGAKPGEGGQLPGRKVDSEIARVRNSTPGVTLISPPPHHDIYSIEDLSQLIYDLRCANPNAKVSVKLVAKSGVGTVAAGVAKGEADSILISGHDGGTGASPLSSLMHAGSYWELGLAETQQSLCQNRLREKVRIQCDGQLKTGRDVLVAALLGAEEFGFGTSCLVALGCIMMRKCHTNSCPVGIATQDPRCRAHFNGQSDHVVNMMRFIAQELRELMARLGYESLEMLIGRADLLKPDESNPALRENHIDLYPMLHRITNESSVVTKNGHLKTETARHFESKREAATGPETRLEIGLEAELLGLCQKTLGKGFEKLRQNPPDFCDSQEAKSGFYCQRKIDNSQRTIGATISYHISKNWGLAGLPDKAIHLKFCGSAGQSFGAFAAHGLQLELEGESNDYFGKGLSGGRLILYPFVSLRESDNAENFQKTESSPEKFQQEHHNLTDLHSQEQNLIVGNVCLFGATAGSAYIAGQAGERFAVRNSGATAVVEGLGAHGCEYMTGGRVVVLGPTGLNFGAGMSGGIAYIWDIESNFAQRCNQQQVELSTLEPFPGEREWLRKRIEQHLHYTQSQRAQRLLSNWGHSASQFVRLIPTEYKRVLQQLAAQQRLPESKAVSL